MRDRDIDLNEAGTLPSSDGSFEGSTNGAAVPDRALRRGYMLQAPEETYRDNFLMRPREDDDGTNYVGDPNDSTGGFLNRPRGWER